MSKGVAVVSKRHSFVVTVNFDNELSTSKALKAIKNTFPKGAEIGDYETALGSVKSVKSVL